MARGFQRRDSARNRRQELVLPRPGEIPVEREYLLDAEEIHEYERRAVGEGVRMIGVTPKQLPGIGLDVFGDELEPNRSGPEVFAQLDLLGRLTREPRHEFIEYV